MSSPTLRIAASSISIGKGGVHNHARTRNGYMLMLETVLSRCGLKCISELNIPEFSYCNFKEFSTLNKILAAMRRIPM